jgi:ABC-type phosphate/phosphonate transport system substrate-binding protein
MAGSIRIITTRYQDAVPFYIENGFAQVGATAAKSVVKSWTDKGGKILVQSRAVPIKQILVSKTMPADEQDRVRAALLGMALSKPGKDALDAVGYKGFVATNPEVEASTIAWLGL